jgi:drug/metabolite transporter (DMT)-like permease
MNPRLGLLYALLAAAAYALMSWLVHWNPKNFPVEQMTLVRGVITVLGVLPYCWRDLPAYWRKGASALYTRAFLGAVGLFLYYFTLQGTVSGNANFLFWGAAPLFVSSLSWIFLRERLNRREACGVGLVLFANVLLYIPTRSSMPIWVWETGLAGAFVSSLAYLTLGKVTKRYSSALIVFGFGAMSIAFSLFWPGKPWISPSSGDWGYLCLAGVLGLLSQLFTTLSFVHLKSGIATSLGRTSVLFSGALDIFLGGYHPHWLEWTSYLVVVAGVALAQKWENRARPEPELAPVEAT